MSSRRKFLQSMLSVPVIASIPAVSFASGKSDYSGKFGHKFKTSLNVYSFNRPLREGKMDLFDVLDFCAENNFDAVDPTGYYFPGYPEVPTEKFMYEFKRKAYLLGLDISGTGVRNDFANPDEASRQADIKMIKEWIKAAAKMGIPNVRVFAGKHEHEGYTRDQVFEWMARDLQECCDFGKQYGVIVAVQNHNDFFQTADDVERIFEMVDSEWLGLNLDIGSYRHGDPFSQIRRTVKYAVTWQVKENMYVDGEPVKTDMVKLFNIIKEEGYRGYLPIETLGEGDPKEKIRVLMKEVRS
ncbi:MAG TPA: sugar phosphate isomerase/epimerase family protein, partial [Bacteroidales bacterium]|nr:sugar phosphate isomerase/epimerase family protein [Bacteroidales bacterium]